jgi:hypothetical protein
LILLSLQSSIPTNHRRYHNFTQLCCGFLRYDKHRGDASNARRRWGRRCQWQPLRYKQIFRKLTSSGDRTDPVIQQSAIPTRRLPPLQPPPRHRPQPQPIPSTSKPEPLLLCNVMHCKRLTLRREVHSTSTLVSAYPDMMQWIEKGGSCEDKPWCW